MVDRKSTWTKWLMIIGLIMGLILTGCSRNSTVGQTPGETASTMDSTTDTSLPEMTQTSIPLPTETPQPGKVILITSGMDESTKQELHTILSDLASQNGLQIEEQSDFQTASIGSDCKVAVMYNPDAAALEATAAIPATQFIVLTDQEVSPASNQNIIRLRRDKQSFVAGYLSVLITTDWRAAGFFTTDTSGDTDEQAFLNGGGYFCGICNPYYAPLVRFPITSRIKGSDDPSVWQDELDSVLADIIYTAYVSSDSESTALWDTLAQNGLIFIGTGNPPEGLESQWAVSVILDFTSPLTEMWPNVVNGQGGNTIETPVNLTNINQEYLTEGKQLLVEEVIKDLDDGWVSPLDVTE